MAKARALDRRRKSVKNIRKITRTMELIATARFKKAMKELKKQNSTAEQSTEDGDKSGDKEGGKGNGRHKKK